MMLPMLFGAVLNGVIYTTSALYFGASAGASYAYGRKVGRISCEKIDEFENRITTALALRNSGSE